MIPLTIVSLALIALLAWREHGHRQQVQELLTLRMERPDLTPVVPVIDDSEPEGYREEDEIRDLLKVEP